MWYISGDFSSLGCAFLEILNVLKRVCLFFLNQEKKLLKFYSIHNYSKITLLAIYGSVRMSLLETAGLMNCVSLGVPYLHSMWISVPGVVQSTACTAVQNDLTLHTQWFLFLFFPWLRGKSSILSLKKPLIFNR